MGLAFHRWLESGLVRAAGRSMAMRITLEFLRSWRRARLLNYLGGESASAGSKSCDLELSCCCYKCVDGGSVLT
jgi:hypothetical protein